MFSFIECTKDANSPQPGLQCIMLLLRSTADAETDASFVVSSTNALVVKTLSVVSHSSRKKFLPVTLIVKTKCVQSIWAARISSPSEKCVLSLVSPKELGMQNPKYYRCSARFRFLSLSPPL